MGNLSNLHFVAQTASRALLRVTTAGAQGFPGYVEG